MGKIQNKIRLLKSIKLVELSIITPILLIFPILSFNSIDLGAILEILRTN